MTNTIFPQQFKGYKSFLLLRLSTKRDVFLQFGYLLERSCSEITVSFLHFLVQPLSVLEISAECEKDCWRVHRGKVNRVNCRGNSTVIPPIYFCHVSCEDERKLDIRKL